MIWAPVVSTCSGVMAFIAACVPTGMKIGVSITPWGVSRRPRRAAVVVSFFSSVKRIADKPFNLDSADEHSVSSQLPLLGNGIRQIIEHPSGGVKETAA